MMTYLGTSDNILTLNTLDRLVHADTTENWVWRETLPVSASLWSSAEWTGSRAKLNSNSLALVLSTDSSTTLAQKPTVKGGRNSASRWKGGDVVCETNTCWSILETESVETEAGDGTSGSDATFTHPSSYTFISISLSKHIKVMIRTSGSQVNFLNQRHLAHEFSCLVIGISPVTLTIHPWRRIEWWR